MLLLYSAGIRLILSHAPPSHEETEFGPSAANESRHEAGSWPALIDKSASGGDIPALTQAPVQPQVNWKSIAFSYPLNSDYQDYHTA